MLNKILEFVIIVREILHNAVHRHIVSTPALYIIHCMLFFERQTGSNSKV